MPVIEFENVSKRYRLGVGTSLRDTISRLWKRKSGNEDLLWALDDVSFHVEPGEILGLIGPNGAGKTTVLSLLAGITAPYKGRITVIGRIGALINLGAGFHPELTGGENIYLNGSILGLSRREIESKFEDIVEFSGIARFINTPVKRYSAGMYVRLGFAVAAHIDPDVLLIDEVLSVGDAAFRSKCYDRIRELQEKETSIVLVSHNLWAVRALCDRVILIRNGTVELVGKPDEVILEYQRLASEDGKYKLPVDPFLTSSFAKITRIVLLNDNGKVQDTFHAGESMIIRADYIVNQELKDVCFELGVERDDKVMCWVDRTIHKQENIESLKGSGWFQVRIDPLQLMAGNYTAKMQINMVPPEVTFAQALTRFNVVSSIPNAGPLQGVFIPLTEWKHHKNSDAAED
ncbi:ABC transporter ATP-binding protein [Thermodesulfobacteriota bacterium]